MKEYLDSLIAESSDIDCSQDLKDAMFLGILTLALKANESNRLESNDLLEIQLKLMGIKKQ